MDFKIAVLAGDGIGPEISVPVSYTHLSQCILQSRPKTMRITVDGELGKGVTAKDVALYMMSKMTTSGATAVSYTHLRCRPYG